jgi:hypothetical protein
MKQQTTGWSVCSEKSRVRIAASSLQSGYPTTKVQVTDLEETVLADVDVEDVGEEGGMTIANLGVGHHELGDPHRAKVGHFGAG